MEKKKSTKELADALNRASRERKEKVWKDLAKRLSKPSRGLAGVNLEKLQRAAEKNKGKVLVVPGKVLGKGELVLEAEVSAFSFSKEAGRKIRERGKAFSITELLESKKKGSEIVIVK